MTRVWEHLGGEADLVAARRRRANWLTCCGPGARTRDRKEERQVSVQGKGQGCCAVGLKEHFSSIV